MKHTFLFPALFIFLFGFLMSDRAYSQTSNVLFHVTAGFPEGVGLGFRAMTGDARLGLMASAGGGGSSLSSYFAYHFAGNPRKGPQKPWFISQHIIFTNFEPEPGRNDFDFRTFSGFRLGYEYFPVSRLGIALEGGFTMPLSEIALEDTPIFWPSASLTLMTRF